MHYLIKTILQRDYLEATDVQTPGGTYCLTSQKEVADWCHTFMRALAQQGWRKEKGDRAITTNAGVPNDRLTLVSNDLKLQGLEMIISLASEKTGDKIIIKIELIESISAFEAAKLFNR